MGGSVGEIKSKRGGRKWEREEGSEGGERRRDRWEGERVGQARRRVRKEIAYSSE